MSTPPNGELTITREKIDALHREIQRVYRLQPVLQTLCSEGKDSSLVRQLVWEAIELLPVEQRTKPIQILQGDVGTVETPQVRQRIHRTAELIRKAAAARRMPVEVHVAHPALCESFWVLMLGKGYSAPTVKHRWCQPRMKIAPLTRLARSVAAPYGGRVIQAIGSRDDESVNRATTLAKYAIAGFHLPLRANPNFPDGYLYLPIQGFTTADVWYYLSNVRSPLSPMYNLELRALYKSAADGECPVMIDRSQPSCGSSRSGCWTCSVPTSNRSLLSLADHPDFEWMYPLVEIYQFLKLTTDPLNKPLYRDPKFQPDGTVKMLDRDPTIPMPGRYNWATCKLILEMLGKAQAQIRDEGPDAHFELITLPELQAIRHLWFVRHATEAIRAAREPFAVSQAELDARIPQLLDRWHARPDEAPADEARAIVRRLFGEDLGAWSPDEAALLEKPIEARDISQAEQMTLDLFGVTTTREAA